MDSLMRDLTERDALNYPRDLLELELKNLPRRGSFGYSKWTPIQDRYWGYQLGPRLRLALRSFYTYEHYGRLRVPRLTRHVRRIEVYRDSPGRLYGDTFTVLERVVVGESNWKREDAIRERLERLVQRAFGIDTISWSR